MSERITYTYNRLFEVHLFHHYWLDDGMTCFDLITDKKKKARHLLMYDVRSFLVVTPTAATTKTLRALRCVFKNTAFGFIVGVPEKIVIHDDTIFEFIVTVLNADFFSYTTLTLNPQRIYEPKDKSKKKIYRYKENVPVFSNLTGSIRTPVGSDKMLFLSKEIPDSNDNPNRTNIAPNNKVECFFIDKDADNPNKDTLYQRTSDYLSDTKKLGEKEMLPVFVNQADVPDLTAPIDIDEIEEMPKRGIRLTEDIPDNVFALIHLYTLNKSKNDFSFTDDIGHAKPTFPVYQIRFKNRMTYWYYYDKNDLAHYSDKVDLKPFLPLQNPLPLTFFGNARDDTETDKKKPLHKPSEGLVKAEKNGDKITKLVSEIFVSTPQP